MTKRKYRAGTPGHQRYVDGITLSAIKRRIKTGEPRALFVEKGWLPC